MTTLIDESIRNGIDTAVLDATLDVVRAHPDAARFQFRAGTEWVDGTHSRSRISGYHGVGQARERDRAFELDADHPTVLLGRDHGPTPVEYVLHALAACLTAGLAVAAAQRGVRITGIRSTVVGDIDLNGHLRLDPGVRNGFEGISIRFAVDGDAPADVLAELVEQARSRSAVYDIIANPVPVTIEL